MPEPRSLDIATPVTTLSMVALYEQTRPRLLALRDLARPLALRRIVAQVPAEIAGDARQLLNDAGAVVSRQRGARQALQWRGPLDWATLLAKLELALVGFDAFRSRYSAYDSAYGYVVWHDELWRDWHEHPPEFAAAPVP
ncbi:MAG: hypothetical protein ABIQ30_10725 [Devosia sp.]